MHLKKHFFFLFDENFEFSRYLEKRSFDKSEIFWSGVDIINMTPILLTEMFLLYNIHFIFRYPVLQHSILKIHERQKLLSLPLYHRFFRKYRFFYSSLHSVKGWEGIWNSKPFIRAVSRLCSHAALRESLLFRVAKIWVTVVQEFLQTSSRCTLNKHNLYHKATSLSQKNFVPDNTMRFSRSLLRYLLLTLFSRLLVIVRFLMLLLLRKMWIRTYM